MAEMQSGRAQNSLEDIFDAAEALNKFLDEHFDAINSYVGQFQSYLISLMDTGEEYHNSNEHLYGFSSGEDYQYGPFGGERKHENR